MSARSLTRPSLSVALHGGFALMRMHAVRKVPHDPLQQLVYEHDDIAHFARYVLWVSLCIVVVSIVLGDCGVVLLCVGYTVRCIERPGWIH